MSSPATEQKQINCCFLEKFVNRYSPTLRSHIPMEDTALQYCISQNARRRNWIKPSRRCNTCALAGLKTIHNQIYCTNMRESMEPCKNPDHGRIAHPRDQPIQSVWLVCHQFRQVCRQGRCWKLRATKSNSVLAMFLHNLCWHRNPNHNKIALQNLMLWIGIRRRLSNLVQSILEKTKFNRINRKKTKSNENKMNHMISTEWCNKWNEYANFVCCYFWMSLTCTR